MPAPARATEPPIETLPLEERIQRRAYELYMQRSNESGSELDDWLQAEEEIRRAFLNHFRILPLTSQVAEETIILRRKYRMKLPDAIDASLVALVEAADGGVFRSDNGGKNWTRINSERKLQQRAWYYTRIYADPKNIFETSLNLRSKL